MNVSIKYILQDKFTFLGFLVSILLLLISVGFILVSLNSLPPYLPLYNKLPWGYARLGQKGEIFIPIGIVMVFLVGNIFTASYIYPKIPLLARLICLVSFFIALFTCIYVIKIVSIVV